MSTARTANLLGALALALSDEIRSAAERQVTHGGSAPAALSLIGHEPGLSIDELALTTPGSSPDGITNGNDGYLWFTERDRNRMRFLVDNLTSALAPSNVPLVNPASAKTAIDTGGLSLHVFSIP